MGDRIRDGKFRIGQLVNHRLFDYRGVVFDVDPVFQGSEEWYVTMARSRPPKDNPWYHVLVHQGIHSTYVAERNLKADSAVTPVIHHAMDQIFSAFENGAYTPRRRGN